MSDFYIDQRLTHPEHGPCIVTFVGSDYVGIELDSGENVLVKKAAFRGASATGLQAIQQEGKPLPWPESTFIHEPNEARHYPGAHWAAFFDDPKTAIEAILPEIARTAEPWIGGVNQEAPRPLPEGWMRGGVHAWPNHRQGLMAVISRGERNTLRNLYPFITDGGQHTLVIRRVNVWESGVEAQIEAEFGESIVTFFDIAYAKHRLWYEAGNRHEFILAGIAYAARPSEPVEVKVNHHPDEFEWQCLLARKRGVPMPEIPSILNLRGMATLMSIDGLDADDYSFRGPVKRVKDVDLDMLGQRGWFVKVTVMRFGDRDANLDMLITPRAWQGDDPPYVGQDIEGSLWLQGYLWCE